ncbi:putative ankyrin repeat-containing protein [Neospora caninum Liverpool]|uniref:Putative ankyrin repeat-containing protein n=1 Tax=Neospora caninum (strain Liverpool) TaxID=572307 RepID=F0V819_NEOCL|nr:putative ankyrin repeat-containing protein [Neospora caninum Liverpool]CBZ49860.1 putative ankyrin repeat-containing protein [Neospora caninum Liverpool]|eukprot:XP_003879895.1 putative ankyrin repeat-containing protein [Neospora caninum Liverpool]
MDPGAANAAGDPAVLVAAQQPESFDQEPFWDAFFGPFCASRPQEIPPLLNQPGSGGETCLHVAAAGQRASLVRNLLFWGADLTARNSRDQLPAIESEWIQDLETNPLLATEGAEAGGELPRNAADEETHKCAISTEDPVDPLLGNREGHTVSENVQMSPGNAQASVRTQSESSSRAGSRRSERKGKDGEDATQKPLDRSGDTGKSSESGRVPQRGNEDKNGPSGGGGIASAADASALGDVYAESESFRPNARDQGEPALEQSGADWVAREVETLDNEYEQMSVEAEDLRDELKRVKEENARAEKKLAMKFSTTGDFPVYRAQTGDPRLTTLQYFTTLRTLEATEEEKNRTSTLTTGKVQQETRKLATHREKVEECRAAFRGFLRKVAKNSQMARSGKPIPESILEQLMQLEEEKTRALQEARSTSTKLKHQLDVLHQLASENDMQEQFHVMDFEQLKIENQALNEKIVERNEEIKKLRSIIVSAVQFITHGREKIHFLDHENARLMEELAHLDAELANQRHLITKSKRERDEYRTENNKLRQQTDIINSDILTLDWETRQQRQQELKLEVVDRSF